MGYFIPNRGPFLEIAKELGDFRASSGRIFSRRLMLRPAGELYQIDRLEREYFYVLFTFTFHSNSPFSFLYFLYYYLCSWNFNVQVIKKNKKPDSHRYLGGDFLHWTAGKLRWNNKIQNMVFFWKIPIYQTCVEFNEKSEEFGRFLRFFEHVFFKLWPTWRVHLSTLCFFVFSYLN